MATKKKVKVEEKTDNKPKNFVYKYIGNTIVNLTTFNMEVKPNTTVTLPVEIDNPLFERIN